MKCPECDGEGKVFPNIPASMMPGINCDYRDTCKKCGGSGILNEKDQEDVFFPKIGEYYQAVCLYNGVVDKKCPNNIDSLCSTRLHKRPKNFYHEWDGRNAWKCPCG